MFWFRLLNKNLFARRSGGTPSGSIRITGLSGTHPFEAIVPVEKMKPLESNSALRYLWARHRIALLSDYNHLRPNDERVREVTSLGLSYNPLTAYTSFVAIDSQVRLVDGQAVTVKQPLPLPQGVSNYAVGDAAKTAAPCRAAFGFLQAHRAYSKNDADKQEAVAYESKTVDEERGTIRAESERRKLQKDLPPLKSFRAASWRS